MADFLYCLNSSTIKTAPILDKISIAAETGFEAIELWHDDIDAHIAGGGTLSDIQHALDDCGLTVPTTIHLKDWFNSTGEEHTKALDECKRRMEQAAAVGALHVIAGPPPGKADRVLGAKHYCELLELGKRFSVKPAMEYLGFVEDINTIDAALDVITKAGHADATIVHDPFHIFRGGGSVESITKTRGEQIAICHFNDVPESPPREQQRDGDRVMPGDGCFDLRRLLTLLRQVKYNRWLSLELFREDLWSQDPREVARVGLEKMRTLVEG